MVISRNYLVIAPAVVVSLVLMGLPDEQKLKIAGYGRMAIWSTSQRVFSKVIRYAKNEQKSRFLLAHNVGLALDNMQSREAVLENQRLRQALEFKRREVSHPLILAEVIGRDPDQIYDSIIIDVGEDKGIQKDLPVVTAKGLVGHVAQVGQSSSIVRLIMRSRVSAAVQNRERAQGIVSWVQGKRFKLGMVEANSEIKLGDRVVSSGLGGRYPKGILIGYVTEVSDKQSNPLFLEVQIESSVDFLKLEEVFVWHSEEG